MVAFSEIVTIDPLTVVHGCSEQNVKVAIVNAQGWVYETKDYPSHHECILQKKLVTRGCRPK